MEHSAFYIVITTYIALIIALTGFHVPSLASNISIFRNTPEVTNYYSAGFQRIFRWPLAVRVVVFMAPLLCIYATFAWPLLVVFEVLPDADYLFPPNLWVALLLVFVGLGMVFISIAVIRKQNQQSGDSFKLHTSAIFDITRNPGLVGMYLYAFGLWWLMPSMIFLIGLTIYVLYMHFKVLMEEDFLANKFGDDYKQYVRDTARYLFV